MDDQKRNNPCVFYVNKFPEKVFFPYGNVFILFLASLRRQNIIQLKKQTNPKTMKYLD